MLVLASTSPYRRDLLARLRVPFDVMHPQLDEAPLPGESGPATALRLAEAKARAAAAQYPTALILGSDQVAELDGVRLDKPGGRDRAREQLALASGQEVVFHTAVTLLRVPTGRADSRLVPTRVRFRRLAVRDIDAYLDKEQPYDCAGSAKSEGLGIALLEEISGSDPTALIGLPLIAVASLLRDAGLSVP
ncbi:MAG TPA: Maf family nucleotide pyrophosphatase [Burkholderiales bacterium]|nr:Maf family nucleotide pyrophosphatase [Burkholderiales bacterium]